MLRKGKKDRGKYVFTKRMPANEYKRDNRIRKTTIL